MTDGRCSYGAAQRLNLPLQSLEPALGEYDVFPTRKGVEPVSDGGIHALRWSHVPRPAMHAHTGLKLHVRLSDAFQYEAVACTR
jgi:hypothetical protein